MRKGLSFCLMLAMLLTMVWVPVSAEEQTARIEIRTPEVLPKAGEEFEVVAYISNNPGFCSIQFTLFAENEGIECESMELGNLVKDTETTLNPQATTGAIVSATTVDAVKGDGVVVTYVFSTKENIENFDFKVRDVEFVGVEQKRLACEFVGATEVNAENASEEEVDMVPVEPTVTEHLFADTIGHWAEEYINFVTKKGLLSGDANGRFNPDANITRAQLIAALWRMAGSPAVNVDVPFTDIDGQIEEFRTAIAWGYGNGFINGISESTFDPDGFITREMAMNVVHSYSGGKSGMEMMFTAIYNGHFEDSDAISSWAKASVWWSVYHRLVSGTTKTTISPQDTATRAQIAKILVNYINSTHIN